MIPITFKCPNCEHTTITERFKPATIFRVLAAIHQDKYTIYEPGSNANDSQITWQCTKCGWQLPPRTVTELVEYLKRFV